VPLMATDVDNLPWWIGLTSGTSGAPKSVARTHAREEMLSAVYPGAEHEYYQRVCVWQNCLTSAIVSPDLTSKSFLARLRADRPAVLESVVVPFAKREGELPMLIAVVVTSEDVDADALKQLCLAKIGNTAVPFKVVFTAALPKNESGKVMRRAVQSGLRVAKKDPP
jgi:acyl-coenzyme A synthetase/AMP-(fatty) acid ligase